jgi:hypothetical protein
MHSNINGKDNIDCYGHWQNEAAFRIRTRDLRGSCPSHTLPSRARRCPRLTHGVRVGTSDEHLMFIALCFALIAVLSAARAAPQPLCSTDWTRPSLPHLRLRGGSSATAVGAPWDDVGAPGYGDIVRERLRPLGERASSQQRPRTLTVPGTHANMSHALASVGDGDHTIFACRFRV